MRHSAPLRCMRVTNFEIPVFVGKNNDKPMSKQMYSSSGIWPCCVCFSVFFQIIAKSLLWIQLSKLSCSLMWCQLIQGWRQQDQNIWGSGVNKTKQKKKAIWPDQKKADRSASESPQLTSVTLISLASQHTLQSPWGLDSIKVILLSFASLAIQVIWNPVITAKSVFSCCSALCVQHCCFLEKHIQLPRKLGKG